MRQRPNTSLYLRHLPETVRPEEVKALFSKYGQVRDVYIPCDHYTNRPRGFAYVEYFNDLRDAEEAVYDLGRGLRLHGSNVDVEFAVGERKTPGEMRHRYGPLPRSSRDHRRRSRSRDRRRSSSRGHRRSRSTSRSRKSKSRKRRSSNSAGSRSSSSSAASSRSRSRSRSRKHRSSRKDRRRSRSSAKRDKKRRSRSGSRKRSRSGSRKRSRSDSKKRSRSGSRKRSRSGSRKRSRSDSRKRSRSASPTQPQPQVEIVDEEISTTTADAAQPSNGTQASAAAWLNTEENGKD